MNASQYLSFLPLLLYGIALADLFSQWKRFFKPGQIFIPYLLMTIILTETAVYNVFVYAKLIDQLSGLNYFNYLMYLIPPFLFLLTTHTFTPDPDSETEEYFKKQMPIFLTLFSLFAASKFLYEFDENLPILVIRILAIALMILTGIFRKIWMIYIICAIWLILMFVKGGMIST